jgi:hypothetical protein
MDDMRCSCGFRCDGVRAKAIITQAIIRWIVGIVKGIGGIRIRMEYSSWRQVGETEGANFDGSVGPEWKIG